MQQTSIPKDSQVWCDTQRIAVDRFWHFARQGMLIAVGMHCAFAAAGAIAGSLPLVAVQLATIAIYAACFWLAGRGHRKWSIALTWVDLMGHAPLACWLIGVDSGFQYYSWIMLPLLFANVHREIRTKIVLAGALIVVFVALDWWLHRMTPVAPLAPGALAALRYFNIVCFLTALGVLAATHGKTVDEAAGRLGALANTDTLTGLLNRRRMTDELQRAIQRSTQVLPQEGERAWSVVLLDIDYFKSINDEFGHARGDQVIVATGEVLRANTRQGDVIARWGGEEFLVFMPNADVRIAREAAERIRHAVAGGVVRDESDARPVTVTVGVAQWQRGESVDATLHRADAALYSGKYGGRDQVQTAPAQLAEAILSGQALPRRQAAR